MFVVRQAGCVRSAVEVARCLAPLGGLAFAGGDFGSTHGRRFVWVAAAPSVISNDLVPACAEPVAEFFGWDGAPKAPRWFGYVPYEALRGLERTHPDADSRREPFLTKPRWAYYPAVVRIDTESGRVAVEGDDEACVQQLLGALRRRPSPAAFTLRELVLPGERDAHVQSVRRALEYIASGDVYQANVTRLARYAFSGDPVELYLSWYQIARARFPFFLAGRDHSVVGQSPELALRVVGDRLQSWPIKGTRPRGTHREQDDQLRRELQADAKEIAELTMAVDLHRNDLGRCAEVGSVRVHIPYDVDLSPSVWSRYARVEAIKARRAGLEDVLFAVIPCGSVTGAPKVRAMELIAELESERRGLYTGVYGVLSSERAIFAVAIRTMVVTAEGASYGVGGGIVSASDPVREYEETRWKTRDLEKLAQG